jgi:hypothetical protein
MRAGQLSRLSRSPTDLIIPTLIIYHVSLSSRPLPPNMPLCPYIFDNEGFLSEKLNEK